ncbi:hypothetical protein GCM10017783_01280 [Deinococcus piscis]|uniref:Uncharacterized protein n=1 Tax=Deinococcus piscis TaxID=394230 RepID=A0ABQ3JWJ0_9DEIO|nr:hypothetical protein [Deinococcus piscis]GHF93129.1 hypothetical protein GCM10017783_01280 [Deinococcus piscis]
MPAPCRLSAVHFDGGSVLFLIDLDFEADLEAEAARLGELLDRNLAEVFYCDADFCLDLGWYDASGLADGHFPDGQFILRLCGGRVTLREWRTRDLRQLRRFVLQARDRAATLHPRRDLPTTLLELYTDSEPLAAEVDLLLAAHLPGRRVRRRRAWHISGDRLLWTAQPPLTLAEAEAVYAPLKAWQRERQEQASVSELEDWLHRLRS